MNKKLLIGISALVVLSLWLVFTFSNDSATANVSFVPPVYADDHTAKGGLGIDSCTDACLYDVLVFQQLPISPYYCKIGLSVKHKEHDDLQCCCHAASYILVEIRTTQASCDCDVPWICDLYLHGGVGQICEYDEYRTPLFVVENDTPFYYKFWDFAAPGSCYVTGNYQIDCQE